MAWVNRLHHACRPLLRLPDPHDPLRLDALLRLLFVHYLLSGVHLLLHGDGLLNYPHSRDPVTLSLLAAVFDLPGPSHPICHLQQVVHKCGSLYHLVDAGHGRQLHLLASLAHAKVQRRECQIARWNA